MKPVSNILPWKKTVRFSIAVLMGLIILDFYSLYTNAFHFFKADNYIFPVFTLIHFTFLYVLRFKIEEDELTDPAMRTIEYLLYASFLVYVFKTAEALYTLITYSDFAEYVLPATFLPMGILIFLLHLVLVLLSILAIYYRKELVGEYVFDDLNQHIDSWE